MTARAVVVGVPHTEDPRFPDLPEASGDAAEIVKLLDGFDHVALHGQGLTRQQFTEALLRLRDDTAAGDLAFVYISGHGHSSADPTPSGDEPWDECLVLSDKLLNDDWFRQDFWPNVQDGSRWVTFADTCFSATIMYGIGVEQPSTPIERIHDKRVWRLHLGASPDAEPAQISDPSEPGYGLARSYATVEALRQLKKNPNASYRTLWEAIDQAARDLIQANTLVPVPTCRNVSADDRLLDSPAFRILTW